MKTLRRIVRTSFLVATLLVPFAHSQTPPTPATGRSDKLVFLGDPDRVSTWLLTAETAVMQLADGSTRDVEPLKLGMDVLGSIKVRFDRATPSADHKTWAYSGIVTVEWGDGWSVTGDEVVLQKLYPR